MTWENLWEGVLGEFVEATRLGVRSKRRMYAELTIVKTDHTRSMACLGASGGTDIHDYDFDVACQNCSEIYVIRAGVHRARSELFHNNNCPCAPSKSDVRECA